MAKSKADARIEALENEVASLKEVVRQLFEKVEQKKARFWWEGGTLHYVTVGDWATATQENKLATCADFIHGFIKLSDLYQPDMNWENNPNVLLTAYCLPLMACLDTMAVDPEIHHYQMSWAATFAAFQLGFVKRNAIAEEANEQRNSELNKKLMAVIGEANA